MCGRSWSGAGTTRHAGAYLWAIKAHLSGSVIERERPNFK